MNTWDGYGSPADAQQWAMAAEWLQCKALHGGLFDGLGQDVSRWRVLDVILEAVMEAAVEIQEGRTHEACCYDRQRRNHPELALVAQEAQRRDRPAAETGLEQ